MKILKVEQNGKPYYFNYRDEDVKEDCISCFPLGGGFSYSIPKSDIVEMDVILPTDIKKIKVGFDYIEGGIYDAYVDTNCKWNGWECPWMEKDQILKFIENTTDFTGNNNSPMSFRMEGDVLIHHDGEEEYRIEKRILICDTKPIKVWDVSLGLCWQEWTQEEINDNL
ncbi:MAG: hypothetical protein GY853_01585 [PVC group bacterium]|nr:hypothetical protein [PVC group bacterium]